MSTALNARVILRSVACICVWCLLLLSPRTGLAVIIDDFEVGPLSPTVVQGGYAATPPISQSGLPTANVLGGNRTTAASSLNSAELEIDLAEGRLEYDSMTGFSYLKLTYGADVPLGADLLADGVDAFRLRFSDTLIQPYYETYKRGLYRFAVSDNVQTFSLSIHAEMFSLNGDGMIVLPFSQFTAIDFRNLAKIVFDAARIEAGSAINIDEISTIRTLPEPKGLVLASGFIVLAVARPRMPSR